MEGIVGVVLGETVDLSGEGLADLDQKHLDLDHGPFETVAEWPPRQAHETPHDDISQDVPALLEPCLLCPRPHGALEVLSRDTLKACFRELVLDVLDAVDVGAQSCHALLQVSDEFPPSIGAIA